LLMIKISDIIMSTYSDLISGVKNMKILSIGNSFSHDAHKWLHKVAKVNSYDFETIDLDIGGCELENHWKNYLEDNREYYVQINGEYIEEKWSISDVLNEEKWDVITFQQVSHKTGKPDTFEPYLSNLVKVFKDKFPLAKMYFHQTWAYEIDSEHGGFLDYDRNQRKMFDKIKIGAEKGAQIIGGEIIPVGEVIQTLRETVKEFDYKNGGLSLCRDGFHLSEDYGRYAAAATWFAKITGQKVKTTEFEDFDMKLLEKIADVVNSIV